MISWAWVIAGRFGPLLLAIGLAIGAAGPAQAREIKAGVFVSSLSSLSPSDGSFRISAFLWFSDPEGTFDPKAELEVLARSATVQTIARKTFDDGSSYSAVLVEAVVNQAYNVRKYPFDDQTLLLLIETTSDIEKVAFVPDTKDSDIADFVSVPGWTVRALTLESREAAYETGFGYRAESPTFSRLAINIDVSRNRSLLFLEKFTGFLVAFFITAMVFAIPVKEFGTRIGISTGSIFAAVFNRYRLEDAVGYDAVFGLVDQITLITFSAIVFTMALSVAIHNSQDGLLFGVSTARLNRLGLIVITVHALLLAICFAWALLI
ncbi:hypothetical protein [Hartmannibacter diazotrophicus]|nr:hypothetical protein [Hartmannibacter diazotrophicus]